ncbi:SGNH/GDSL hydrolase family protein [Lentisphaerota bacterium WC36G]|nr:hypothetical protein LJT99_01315 [Lentisphaerae bacterium WC36]
MLKNNNSFNIMLKLNHFIATNNFFENSTSISKVCVFAESHSDIGNIHNYTFGAIPQSPPFWNGRFCDGPIWVDYLTKYLTNYNINIENYPINGICCPLRKPFSGYIPFTQKDAIRLYKQKNRYKEHHKHLFIIWIGTNDYLVRKSHYQETSFQLASSIKSMAKDLISIGAENIIFINQLNHAQTPAKLKKEAYNTSLEKSINNYNNNLNKTIHNLSKTHPKTRIGMFDIYGFFNELFTNNNAFNKKYNTKILNNSTSYLNSDFVHHNSSKIFNQLTKRLCEETSSKWAGINLFETVEFLKNCPHISDAALMSEQFSQCEKFYDNKITKTEVENFAFFDRVHFTSAIHKVFSVEFIKFITESFKFNN